MDATPPVHWVSTQQQQDSSLPNTALRSPSQSTEMPREGHIGITYAPSLSLRSDGLAYFSPSDSEFNEGQLLGEA